MLALSRGQRRNQIVNEHGRTPGKDAQGVRPSTAVRRGGRDTAVGAWVAPSTGVLRAPACGCGLLHGPAAGRVRP